MGLFQEFSESTSMHGLQRAVSSESKWKRPLWAALVLAGACLATFNLSKTIKDFLHNPTTTETSVHYSPDMEFPVVTICNLNPFSYGKLTGEMDFMAVIKNLVENGFTEEDDIFEYMAQFQRSRDVAITYSLKDLLIECQFDMMPCSADDFLTVPNYKYGDCFVFNKQIPENFTHSNPRYTTKPGPDNGLIMKLDVQQMQYLYTTEDAGFKIVVHSQDTTAFPEDEGFLVMPGTRTNVGLKRTEMSRAPPPYSTCIGLADEYNVDMNVYSLTDGTRYSGEACRKTCYIREVVRQCGCCDILFVCPSEIYNTYEVNETNPYCNATNTDQFFCKKRVLNAFEKGELDCLGRCLPPCEEVVYDVALSTALWPSENWVFVPPGTSMQDAKNIINYYRENMLRVAIYFEDLTEKHVESRPSYDWNRVLSDIGGQLGLWLGFSILTAMEWLELAYDAGIRAGTRKSQGAQAAKVHVQQQGQ
ncbi:amiloride-sensitive sodium channel subunit gamma-like [Aplysia californica]|uniref:Amiloride-sensitive sodium channel subunit gamma-like n=1 Tax=Aplysia californica TaxID=6500 RepID=A0ABM1A7T0_APLCA|nr:amiloride-sensitive sodium channel subunit gamma-like [Aplysia californica]